MLSERTGERNAKPYVARGIRLTRAQGRQPSLCGTEIPHDSQEPR
jgi:hypothetical protein